MSVSTITAEGGTIRLTTAPDGSISASSADFAVAVVQQVTGGTGGGVTQYASIAALITASQGSLAAGYYAATVPATHPEYPNVVTYWDGTDFLPRALSVVEDWWDDLAIWVLPSTLANIDPSTTERPYLGSQGGLWPDAITGPVIASSAGVVDYSTDLGGSLDTASGVRYEGTINDGRYDISGPFEIFTVVQLSDDTTTNKGVAGKWDGSANGWVLGISDFASPYGVWFGFDGQWVRDSARLGTAPHVVHGRYDGSDIVISVDGTDKDTDTIGADTSSSASPLYVGTYDNSAAQGMLGNFGEIVMVHRALTTGERTALLAEISARAGI